MERALGSMELAGWGPGPGQYMPSSTGLTSEMAGRRGRFHQQNCVHLSYKVQSIPLPQLWGQFSEVLEAFVEHYLMPDPAMDSAEWTTSGQGTASPHPIRCTAWRIRVTTTPGQNLWELHHQRWEKPPPHTPCITSGLSLSTARTSP